MIVYRRLTRIIFVIVGSLSIYILQLQVSINEKLCSICHRIEAFRVQILIFIIVIIDLDLVRIMSNVTSVWHINLINMLLFLMFLLFWAIKSGFYFKRGLKMRTCARFLQAYVNELSETAFPISFKIIFEL